MTSVRSWVRRDQGIATAAWTAVDEVASREASSVREFRTRALTLPAMLQTSGLAATAAFLASKAGQREGQEVAYSSILRALRGRIVSSLGIVNARDDFDLVRWCGKATLAEYRRASVEARDLAGWIRRAAEARWGRATAEGGPGA